MHVVAITGPRQCAIVERPEPRVRDNYVLIKVHVAPMCTEVQQYKTGQPTDALGHEAAGEVVEVATPGRFRVGDRVVVMPQDGCGRCRLCLSGEHVHCVSPRRPLEVCDSPTGRATYAQFLIQQDWLLFPVPEDLTYEEAAMACCGLGPTFNACRRMRVDATDTVLVSGVGAVGMGAIINAKFRGARVIALESHPWRRSKALDLGAEAVLDPTDPEVIDQVLALTDGEGVTASIEASSASTAPALVVKAARRRGKIASVGWGGPVNFADIVAKGLEIHGVWHWNHLQDADAMLATLRGTRRSIQELVTHRLPMSEVKTAWEIQITGECGKIILDPWR